MVSHESGDLLNADMIESANKDVVGVLNPEEKVEAQQEQANAGKPTPVSKHHHTTATDEPTNEELDGAIVEGEESSEVHHEVPSDSASQQ